MLQMTTKASGWVADGWLLGGVGLIRPSLSARPSPSLSSCLRLTFTVCFRCDLAHLTP